MTQIPEDLRYTAEHVWLRAEADGIFTLGVTDFAQNALNDVVFAQLPQTGATAAAGEAVCSLESVKSASDVYAPVAGEIVAVNADLAHSPEQINQDPYHTGWICRIRPHRADDVSALLNAADYRTLT